MKRLVLLFCLLLLPYQAWAGRLYLLDDYTGPSYDFRDGSNNLLALNRILLFDDYTTSGLSTGNKLLLETGDKLLLETNDKFLME